MTHINVSQKKTTKKTPEQLAANLEQRATLGDMGRPADKNDVLRLSAKLIREQAAKIALLEKFMSDLKNLK